jgi:hypothetical protein
LRDDVPTTATRRSSLGRTCRSSTSGELQRAAELPEALLVVGVVEERNDDERAGAALLDGEAAAQVVVQVCRRGAARV